MPALKTGVENDIFWSEIGSGFREPGGAPPPNIPRITPWGVVLVNFPLEFPLFLTEFDAPISLMRRYHQSLHNWIALNGLKVKLLNKADIP